MPQGIDPTIAETVVLNAFINAFSMTNLVLADLGRKPRTHFISRFNLKLNDYFGPTLSYEWGQAPPLYKKVDHQVKLGFTYSFKQKNPE